MVTASSSCKRQQHFEVENIYEHYGLEPHTTDNALDSPLEHCHCAARNAVAATFVASGCCWDEMNPGSGVESDCCCRMSRGDLPDLL